MSAVGKLALHRSFQGSKWRLRVDFHRSPGPLAQYAHALRGTDGNAGSPVIAVDHFDGTHGGIAACRAYRCENLALSGVRHRMQTCKRTDIIEIGDHVGVKDDLDRFLFGFP